MPIKLATQYAAEDADVTFRLYTFFRERLVKENLLKIYELFEKPMVSFLSQMEIEGIKINSVFLKELSKNLNLFLFPLFPFEIANLSLAFQIIHKFLRAFLYLIFL